MTLRIAALASGTGSNVAALARCCEEGRLDATIALVLSNNPTAPVLNFARSKGLPVWAESHTLHTREEFDARLIAAITGAKADVVVLAGYMRLVSLAFIRAFPGRILNIHPALLPAFPGLHGGRDAAEYGVRLTGCTVHFVDEAMDNGPVIIQAAIPVLPGETEHEFMPRVHALEHRIYPQALQWLAEGRLSVKGRTVLLAPPAQAGSTQQDASSSCTLPGCTATIADTSSTCTLPGCSTPGDAILGSATPGSTSGKISTTAALKSTLPGGTIADTTSDDTSSTCTLPGCSTPGDAASGNNTPGDAIPGSVTPGNVTSNNNSTTAALKSTLPGGTIADTTTDDASSTCTLPGCSTPSDTAGAATQASNLPGGTTTSDDTSSTCTLPGCSTPGDAAGSAQFVNIPGSTASSKPSGTTGNEVGGAPSSASSKPHAGNTALLQHPGMTGKNIAASGNSASTTHGPCLVCPPLERF